MLGWEDPWEKGMATHPSILPWRISWTEEPGGLVYGVEKSQDMIQRLTLSLPEMRCSYKFLSVILLKS